MRFLSFAAGSLLAFLLASGASVFLAERLGPAWGNPGSFKVLAVLSAVATVMLLAGFGVAAAVLRRPPHAGRAAAMGAACAIVFIGLVWLASALEANPADSWALLLLLPLLGAAAALFQRRNDG